MITLDAVCEAKNLVGKNPVLISKLEEHASIPSNRTDEALTEVIRFLALIFESGEVLTPSKVVDDVWHQFILCTRAYTDFCERHFGRYIHHQPGGKAEDNARQFRRTLEIYELAFGTPPPRYWDHRWQISGESACGSCENTL